MFGYGYRLGYILLFLFRVLSYLPEHNREVLLRFDMLGVLLHGVLEARLSAHDISFLPENVP